MRRSANKTPIAGYSRSAALTEDDVEEIREAFNLFDSENKGSIDLRDLKQSMQSLGLDTKNPAVFNIIAEIAAGGGGNEVDFDSFLNSLTQRLGDKDSRSGIQRIFNLFDTEHKGSVTFKDLKRVSKELGEQLNDEEIMEMVQRADSNADGEISFEDFYGIMARKH
jgi:centrin-1